MIWFVGAGGGAADLITVRGERLLRAADCIVHAGSLVNPELLRLAKPGAEIRDSARMTLEEVLETLLAAERKGWTTVRLHTGDPSLYGAIREQMDALRAAGVPFDIVPGVSSFSAAAAALKAEYTLPGVSQTLVLTRLAGRTGVPEKEALPLLAAHGASMVLFLSAGMLPEVRRQLLAGGAYTESTPAAIVYRASWPDEKIVRCTVGTLAESGEANGIAKTALVLVGDFLGDEYERSKLYDPAFTTGFRKGTDAE